MRNLQLQQLNRSRLDALRPEEYLLRLEPMSLGRKKLAELEEGDWLDLGGEAPRLEIARDGVRIAPAYPEEEGVRIGPPCEESSRPEPGKKRVPLEGRLAIYSPHRLAPGELVEFSWSFLERIPLYAEGRYLATARLIRHEEGYALEILELADG